MEDFGNNLEEFLQDFKERVVSEVYYTYPKEYRKSDEYHEQELDKKFEMALNSGYAKRIVLDVIKKYYDAIHEYEELLGY